METVGAGKRVCFGERLGKRGGRFFEQVEDGPVGGVPQRLRQCFEFVPGPVGKRRTRSLTDSPRLGEFLAGEGAAFPGV